MIKFFKVRLLMDKNIAAFTISLRENNLCIEIKKVFKIHKQRLQK